MIKIYRRFKDLGIYGEGAKQYDKNTSHYRIEEIRELAKKLCSLLNDGDSILEVATGSGHLLIELSTLGDYKLTGIDISKDIIEIAIRNSKALNKDLHFLQSSASAIPFRDDTFNLVICVLAFKNFKQPVKSLQEMYRVLKPGGLAIIMDLNRKSTKEVMKLIVKNMGLTGISAYFARVIQKNSAYTREEFEEFISQTKFKNAIISDSTLGFTIHLSK